MCGRLYATLTPQQVQTIFGGRRLQKPPPVSGGEKCFPSFNAAPTRFMPVVLPKREENRESDEYEEEQKVSAAKKVEVRIEAMKWGMLVPNTNDLVINGRLEELHSKPFFRGLLEKNRCVLTFNGYFEWKTKATDNSKQPFMFIP